jgi:hypothetical protein
VIAEEHDPTEYMWRRIPSAIDEAVARLCRRVQSAPRAVRSEWLAEIDRAPDVPFLNFVSRWASAAVRTNDAEKLVDCIVALALAARPDEDPRGPVYESAVVIDASERLSASAVEMFLIASEIRPGPHAAMVASFPSRPNGSKTLTAMGYTTVTDRDGFRYVPSGSVPRGAVGVNWPY